jgi:hypothetical protein
LLFLPGAVLVLFPTLCSTQRAAHHHCTGIVVLLFCVLYYILHFLVVQYVTVNWWTVSVQLLLFTPYIPCWKLLYYLQLVCLLLFTWYMPCCYHLLLLLCLLYVVVHFLLFLATVPPCPAQHFQSLTLTCCFLFSSL